MGREKEKQMIWREVNDLCVWCEEDDQMKVSLFRLVVFRSTDRLAVIAHVLCNRSDAEKFVNIWLVVLGQEVEKKKNRKKYGESERNIKYKLGIIRQPYNIRNTVCSTGTTYSNLLVLRGTL